MNDNAIKNYAMWARRELISEVAKKCAFWGISDGDCPSAAADSIDGRVLTSIEKRQRAELLGQVKARGFEQFVETAAYTWFNRILAIRFMEVNDRLPSHVRVLSAQDGAFAPQALQEALDLPLDALDASKAAELVQAGDDEGLFKLVFLAQCDQLAEYMPAVFDRIGGAMELMLPDGLLREGGVIEQLVSSIQESDWLEGVEVIGWMYQYYVSERKDEVFASFKKGKKAERDAIAPATQLFTPNWIVRYLTENSLGRLWMLNYPGSSLTEYMPYFIKPGDDAETEFKKISSPEEITVVDPACGSGHILVYAFDLLARMYAEAGYSDREAARLIVEKNLSGFEIDPRAAAMASFAVTMKACELDSRFLRRGVTPQITVLNRIEFDNEEKSLLRKVSSNLELLDVAAHLDECGSLFKPSQKDLVDIAGDLASLAGEGSLFAATAVEKLERLQAELLPLSERYDVVVANPPYMGAKNMNKWLNAWVKQHYANVKGDLFSCFMVRNSEMGNDHAQMGFMTPYVWMFISTYEKLRKFVIGENTITSLIQLEYSGFAGATVPICTFTLQKGYVKGYKGSYIRLSDFPGADQQAPRVLEALANPDCGWLYKRTAAAYFSIPGSPIAYWASIAVIKAFGNPSLGDVIPVKKGLDTGDNDKYLRLWHEPSFLTLGIGYKDAEEFHSAHARWAPHDKGGEFRRWYGNKEWVIDWAHNGSSLRASSANLRSEQYYFHNAITWCSLSSGLCSFRLSDYGAIPNTAGSSMYPATNGVLYLGLMNSSVVQHLFSFLAPTLNYSAGPVGLIPKAAWRKQNQICDLVEKAIELTKVDWDSTETSWDFGRHPLV